MAEGRVDLQKVYVNPDGMAAIKCPHCETTKTTKVENFKGGRHVIKVRCSCQQVFTVYLEFRRYYRKETRLLGDFFGISRQGTRGKLVIQNISQGGIGAQIMGMNPNQVGDELRVKFALDDQQHSLIEKRVVVRLVKQNYIGCEFLETGSPDKALGFYLMV